MNLQDFFTTHTWWGKIIGGVFGYLTSGPIGALFGILVGNFFDRGLAEHFSNPHLLYHSEKRQEVQKIFFEATFTIMGHIAKADGRVSEHEINMAKSLMDEMLLSKDQKVLAKQLFNEGKQPGFKLDAILSRLNKVCKENRDLLKLFIEIQYRAAQVDGLAPKKIAALDTIFSQLGFSPLHKQYRFYEEFGEGYHEPEYARSQQQQQQRKRYSSSSSHNTYQASNNTLAHAYALLEISPDASKQEVKRAYRRLMSRNHPDKLIAQGLPEEMIKLANDKTQKILKAYELICENKGW